MKKLKQLLAFTLALAMLAIPAMAAGTHSTLGVYDLNVESGYTLTPLKADGSAADRYSGQFDSGVSTVYEGVEKFSQRRPVCCVPAWERRHCSHGEQH